MESPRRRYALIPASNRRGAAGALTARALTRAACLVWLDLVLNGMRQALADPFSWLSN
jgi:hypothetical protein